MDACGARFRRMNKKISSAVPCLTSGRAASSSTFSSGPACLPASRVARPSVATAGVDLGPATTRKQPPGHAQADPLGLGDGGELVLRVGGDLDGVFEPLPEGLDLGLLLGELLLKLVDPGLGRGAVDGLGDLFGLAIKRLP